ncbi:hypothetical protein DFS34DRAFT_611880 [Phlyctochytrium arcticum]|nr:hypothetical protein DFS34DRAFT_611880 [Phlyctochytrium arcticum]
MAAQKDPSPPAATTTPKAEADPEDENWGLHDDEDDDNNRHPPVHKPGEQPITSPYNPPVLPDWGTTYGDWNLEGDEAGGDEDPQDETSYEDLLDQEEAANATTTAAAAATKGEIETATSAAATGSSTEPVTSTPQLPQVPPSKVQSYQPQQQPQHPQQQMQQGGWRGGARGGSREGRPYQRGRGGNMQRGYHPRMMEQQQGMYMPNGGMMPTGFPPHMPAAASRGRGGRKIYVNPAKLDRLPPDLAQAARLILLQQQSQASGGGDAAAAGGYDPDSPGLNGDYRGIPPMGMPHMGPMGMPMGMPMMPGFGGGSSIRGRGGRGGGRYPPNSYGSHGMVRTWCTHFS